MQQRLDDEQVKYRHAGHEDGNDIGRDAQLGRPAVRWR